jgi:cytochrome P450
MSEKSTMLSEIQNQLPPRSDEAYNSSDDLLTWMSSQFKRLGSIFRASAYGGEIYVVSDPVYADHVLRENWQNYRKGQAIKRVGFLLGNGLMVSEGNFWKSQRQMVQPAFHEEAVCALMQVITSANQALLSEWSTAAASNRSVNITSDISRMVLGITLRAIFGEDSEQMEAHFNVLSQESARNLQFAQTFRPLGKVIAALVAERRKENRTASGILGMLMNARDRKSGEPMPEAQLVAEVMTLIVAGHETTASTLSWAWYLLSIHPEVEEKLWRELDALPADRTPTLGDLPRFPFTRQVVEETMRLYPAGWLMTRRALKDDWLGEYFVPAGAEVYIAPYLIQRNPAIWDEPDRFDPDRFCPEKAAQRHPMAMIPFSAGPRKCIGESLARLEMQIHLMMVAKHLRLKRTEGQQVELEAGVNLRNKHDFLMEPAVRL